MSSSQQQYFTSVAGAIAQAPYGPRSFNSTVLGRPVTADVNSQTMIGWWIHTLAVQGEEVQKITTAIEGLAKELWAEKEQNGSLSAASLEKVGATLESLMKWDFGCNGILEEAWNRSVLKTRSGQTYAKVGSKFAENYAAVIKELKQSCPADADELDDIETFYVNKHHLMLKSLYPALQILNANLVHAGIGSAVSSNTPLHKALHQLTALNGKLDFTKMDDQICAEIQKFVKLCEQSLGSEVFQ